MLLFLFEKNVSIIFLGAITLWRVNVHDPIQFKLFDWVARYWISVRFIIHLFSTLKKCSNTNFSNMPYPLTIRAFQVITIYAAISWIMVISTSSKAQVIYSYFFQIYFRVPSWLRELKHIFNLTKLILVDLLLEIWFISSGFKGSKGSNIFIGCHAIYWKIAKTKKKKIIWNK